MSVHESLRIGSKLKDYYDGAKCVQDCFCNIQVALDVHLDALLADVDESICSIVHNHSLMRIIIGLVNTSPSNLIHMHFGVLVI